MDNKFEAYQGLRNSAIGKDLIEWIDSEYMRTMEKANKSSSQEEAFGFVKQAYGIILVKQHIEMMSNSKNR